MRFRFSFWPLLGTVIGLAMLVSLGTWQFSRYQEKRVQEEFQEERLQKPPVEVNSLQDLPDNYSPVEVMGQVDPRYLFLFKHRIHDGKPGGWLGAVMRLQADQGVVLLNLGWIHTEQVDELSHKLLETYPSALTGIVHTPPRIIADEPVRAQLAQADALPESDILTFDSYDLKAIYDALDAPRPREATVVVLGPNHTREPFPVASFEHVTQPYLTAERHLSYAVFWYVTGLALLGMYLASALGYLGSRRPVRRT